MIGRDERAWVLLATDAVPERWRVRAVAVSLVPLVGDEAADLLGGATVRPQLEPLDERLLGLLAGGETVAGIAVEVGVSQRTVERRLATLRRRLGAESTGALALLAARQGFAELTGEPPGPVGGTATGAGE